ncbi:MULTISPECIES: MOSC domain-containing protein [unclassified Campylobacter]|uniref:MOSC domain-containing protein n=1 Tax=unclassified Campylobacter TaxID=2593542 RepID=UPI003D34F264
MARLKALLLGEVKNYGDENSKNPLNKPWVSAIFKVAQEGEIFANTLGFVGDNVADTLHHGGAEKAIFANSLQNYSEWEKFLGLKNLAYGAMGENLTIDGLCEDSVCVGDIHEIGSLVLQVSQPRKPCSKLSKRWDNPDMTAYIAKSGLSGWYYRVLNEGSCKAGDEVKVVQKDSVGMSIAEINRLFHQTDQNLHLLNKFNLLTALTPSFIDAMKTKLNGSYNADFMKVL